MHRLPLVSDVMDRVFIKFKPDMPIKEAIETILKKNLYGACVIDDYGRLLGILSEKECLKLYIDMLEGTSADDLKTGTVGDYYHREVQTVGPDCGVVEVAQIFLANRFRRLPVVQDGRLVGQITRRDIVREMRAFNTKHNYGKV